MRFPLFAMIAPIATSLVLWLVTSSPYTLLFALMGPVMAIASYLDTRRGERRRHRQDALSQEGERSQREAATQLEGALARQNLRETHPAPHHVGQLDHLIRPPWHDDVSLGSVVRLGLMTSDAVPLLVNAVEGITCVGTRAFGLAFTRALWSQLAWNVSPESRATWVFGHEIDDVTATASWPVRLVESLDGVSSTCRFVVRILGPNDALLTDRDDVRGSAVTFVPDYMSTPEVHTLANRLTLAIERVQQERPGATVPAECTLTEILVPFDGKMVGGVRRDTLSVPVGQGDAGIFSLDLVRHGPHAVVAGMTGTGKTEFFVSWILSLAHAFTPRELTVLIIDFKGGSGFSRVAPLPHCMGIMTDLDVPAAQRALDSLRAEMRFRERALNEAGVTDFAFLPPRIELARLVILVDEYRALLVRFPELQSLFDDIAARGRALGVHLVLGTQRAAGVVTEGILANCALRIAFRVNNVTDSMVLIETDAARKLPEIPGRAVVWGTSLPLQHVQCAQTREEDQENVLRRAELWVVAQDAWRPRLPWCPPLPAMVALSDLRMKQLPGIELDALVLGLGDAPEEQRQEPCSYQPLRDGHLLVTGHQRSGKSTLLRALAAQSPEAVYVGAKNAEATWDRVMQAPDNTLLLIDDIEAVVAQFSFEHRDAFLESLVQVLRMGPGRGVFVVITSDSSGMQSSAWTALMGSTLSLEGQPGRGTWAGHPVQLASPQSDADCPRVASADDVAPMEFLRGSDYLVVTSRPQHQVMSLRAHHRNIQIVDLGQHGSGAELSSEQLEVSSTSVARVFIGDVDNWQAKWSLLARLRPHAIFVFDDCSPGEVRAVRRSRDLLPHSRRGGVICLTPNGEATRVTLTC